MNMDRLQQLVVMFVAVTEKTFTDARNIILTTDTGKAIQNNNVTVLYEQQTENLESIVLELKQNGQYVQEAELFTTEAIVSAMQILTEYEQNQREFVLKQNYCASQDIELKKNMQKKTNTAYKEMLKQRSRNQLNLRRIQDADTVKR